MGSGPDGGRPATALACGLRFSPGRLSGELSDLAARCPLPTARPASSSSAGPIASWSPLPPFPREAQRAASARRVTGRPAASGALPDRAAPPTTPRPGPRPGHKAAPSGRGGRGSSHAADGQGAGPGAEARAARSPDSCGAAARPSRPRAAGARGTAGTRPGGQTRRREER